jgi:hypothetical protein
MQGGGGSNLTRRWSALLWRTPRLASPSGPSRFPAGGSVAAAGPGPFETLVAWAREA